MYGLLVHVEFRCEKACPMSEESRLEELVSIWQRELEQGNSVSAEDLCREEPELLADLEQRIEILKRMGGFAEKLASSEETAEESGNQDGNSFQSTGKQTTNPDHPFRQTNEQSSATTVTIPGYELLDELGRGGMGVVYKAHHVHLGRTVALKMIHAGGRASASEMQRFRTEAQAIAKLQDPHIVQIFEVGSHEGTPFFSLEYCNGGSLNKMLKGTPLSNTQAAMLVETLARAIHYAHQNGVIHRDLKPANILLAGKDPTESDSGSPQSKTFTLTDPSTDSVQEKTAVAKITDFGLAKIVDDEQDQTRSGAVMGTPSYMAPEQAEGKTREIGPAVDIYSLGAILYECLTGRPPFRAATTMETLVQVIHNEPVPPRRLQPNCDVDLETVCLKCLQKDPKKRYATAAELAEDLRRYGNGEGVLARPISRAERFWRWCRRNPRVASLMFVLLLVIAGSLFGLTGLYLLAEERRHQAEQDRTAAIKAKKATEDALVVARTEKNNAEIAQKFAENEKRNAEKQRNRAEAETVKARKTADFLLGLFRVSDPIGLQGYSYFAPAGGSKSLTAEKLLDRGAKRIQTDLETAPGIKADLMDTIGNVYRSLGYFKRSENILLEAHKIRTKHLGEDSPKNSENLFNLGWLYQEMGRFDKAKQCYEESLKLRKDEFGDDHPIIATTQFNLAMLLFQMEEHERAQQLFQDVIDRRIKQHGTGQHRDVAIAQAGLAALYMDWGDFPSAFPLAMSSLHTFRTVEPDNKVIQSVALFQQAILAEFQSNKQKAKQLLEESVRLAVEEIGPTHPYLVFQYFHLADIADRMRDPILAEQYFRKSQDIINSVAPHHPRALVFVKRYSWFLVDRKRIREAGRLYEDYLAKQRETFGPDHPFVAKTLVAYSQFLRNRREYNHRIQVLEEAAAIYRHGTQRYGNRDKYFQETLKLLAQAYRWQNRLDEAFRVCLERRRLAFADGENLVDIAGELANLMDQASEIEASEYEREVMETLQSATQQGFKDSLDINTDPRFGSIRTQPQFASLLKEMDSADWSKYLIKHNRLTNADLPDPRQPRCRHKVYRLNLKVGHRYQIDLKSFAFDAYLRIEDEAKKKLADNDDGGDNMNARLSFRPSKTATYRIVVSTWRHYQTGRYCLVVRDQGRSLLPFTIPSFTTKK